MTARPDSSRWLATIDDAIERHGCRGAFLVSFPDYRPELAAIIADRLDMPLCDFRADIMAPLGWNAATLTLASLESAIVDRLDARGLVLSNAEALLAAKTASDRQSWFQEVLTIPRTAPLIVPIALFAADADRESDRFIALSTDDLPESTLLTRLLAMR